VSGAGSIGWKRALLSGSLLAFAAAPLALAGCAGHAGTMAGVRAALHEYDLEEARARLAEAGRGTGDLLFALEDGLLLHYAGDPELSNARFEFVEGRIDDLYTKSVGRALLSLVTSDLVLRFEPRGIENFLVNYYRALNYLGLGEPQEAWVEWRKLASKLQFAREQGDAPYLDPPFFEHLVGLGLEWDDPDNAYVSLRLAEAAYRARGARPPADLVEDLVRLAGALGFRDDIERYRDRYGERAVRRGGGHGSAAGDVAGGRDRGEIVLLVEEGLVAPIEEVQVYIPITKARARRLHEGDTDIRLGLAESLAREYHAGRYQGVKQSYSHRREIAYVLPLSFPVFAEGEPAFRSLAAAADDETVPARVALAVTELQRQAFQDRLLGIYAKTIARALIKYAAAVKLEEEAEDESGEAAGDVVGVLANVVNVLTERADTRAWLGLPHRIWMARLRVPPGGHELRIVIDGRETVSLGPVEIGPGERRFVSYRVF
jgi:hypothetical protein